MTFFTKITLATIIAQALAAPIDLFLRDANLVCVPNGKTTDCSCKANYNPDLFSKDYKLNNFASDCANPVNLNSCSTNGDACSLYAHIIDKTKITSEGAPVIPKASYGSTYDHTILSSTAQKWLLLPGSWENPQAVTGIEDKRRQESTITVAWFTRFTMGNYLISKHSKEFTDAHALYNTVGIAVNPSTSRSRHQMHLHIGRVKQPVIQALNPSMTTLTKLPKIEGTQMYAIFYPGSAPENVFDKSLQLMQTPAKDAGRSDYQTLNHHSVVIVPGQAGGYYVLIGWDQHSEAMICQDADMTSGLATCLYH